MSKLRSALTAVAALAAAAAPLVAGGTAKAGAPHANLNCRTALCAEVLDPEQVFGEGNYVGHDEPSNLFYSNVKGSGNNVQYHLKLPTDPTPTAPNTPGKSYQFQLNGSFWFGMALCDTQSYPEQVSTCTPDSDTNIVDPAVSPNHPGTAFLELQFYPPGWVAWPTWQVSLGAGSCDPTKWCAAMNLFSVLQDPVHGTSENATCANQIGIETVSFAFLTRSGHPQAPPDPVNSTVTTFTPDPTKDLFMNSGDNIVLSMHDTRHGLQTILKDQTTGETGSMTASAANGFKQVKFDPTGTGCTTIPYDFHPMYSTSSEKTRVIWAAHSYNIAFASEIGHFEFCKGAPVPSTAFGAPCPAGNTEGSGAGTRPTDADETTFCFPGSRSSLVKIEGCTDQNNGFDGLDYQPVWPDGNTALHPTSLLFSSPTTGEEYSTQFSRHAFEADLPRIEANTCNRTTGAGCTLIPTTDRGTPANFYPFFSTRGHESCSWQFGNDTPGTTNDFGRNAQYGSLLSSTYLAFGGGGATVNRFNNFRQVLPNTCRAED